MYKRSFINKKTKSSQKISRKFFIRIFTAYISSFVNLWILIALLYSVILLWVCWDLAPHFIIPWSSFSEWNSRLNCTVIICTFALPQSWVKLCYLSLMLWLLLCCMLLWVLLTFFNTSNRSKWSCTKHLRFTPFADVLHWASSYHRHALLFFISEPVSASKAFCKICCNIQSNIHLQLFCWVDLPWGLHK